MDRTPSPPPSDLAPPIGPVTTGRVARRGPGSRLANAIAVSLAALGWGLFLGAQFLTNPGSPTDPPVQSSRPLGSDHPPEVEQEPLPEVDPVAEVRRADFLLQYGSVDEAYRIYLRRHAQSSPRNRGWLTYRLGLASEFLGQAERALEWYRALHEEKTDPHTLILAEIGRARVLLHEGQTTAARQVLRSLEATRDQSQVSPSLRGASLHLLAQACTREILQTERRSQYPFIAIPPHDLSATQLLNWFTNRQETKPRPAPDPHFTVLMRLGPELDQIFISCLLPAARVHDLVTRIAETGNMAVEFSSLASRRAQSIAQSVYFENISLASALDSILDRGELSWRQGPRGIVIQGLEELEAEDRHRYRVGLAYRLLTRATIQFPDHELKPNTEFLRGTLEYQEHNLEGARLLFQGLAEATRHSGNSPAAWLNLGTLWTLLGRQNEALDAYHRVIDGIEDPQAESLAYLEIGELLLTQGRIEDALRPLIRAVSLATEADIKAQATLILSAAYLQLGNAHAAHATLVEGRADLNREPWNHWGQLLECLVSERIALEPAEKANKQRRLFAALARLDGNLVPAELLWLCLADAYQALGLTGETVRTLQAALERCQSLDLKSHMVRRLLQHYLASDRWSEAEELLALSLEQGWEGANYVRLKKAEIAWYRSQYAHCIRLCEQVLDDAPAESEVTEALRMMGQAYQAESKYDRAALCFAGLKPPTETSH